MRVLLTGGSGMLGSAFRRLAPNVASDIELLCPTRHELPLEGAKTVSDWLVSNKVEAVIHAAARVGGIQENINHPVDFLVENMRMNDAVIMGSHGAGIERLIFLGSSCMYPRDYRQPLEENDVLAAPLEPTNEGYALSKITASRLCDYISGSHPQRHYRTFIPCNLFGTEDHFGSVASHLIAAIVTKVINARDSGADTVEIWGSGNARREFLFTDDLVPFMLDALCRLENLPGLLNIGYDSDHSVNEYYQMVADLAGYNGKFTHDTSKPEGMMRKCMTSARAKSLGFDAKTDIRQALTQVIAAYEKQRAP
jgi:GDP-L-fucose synthase